VEQLVAAQLAGIDPATYRVKKQRNLNPIWMGLRFFGYLMEQLVPDHFPGIDPAAYRIRNLKKCPFYLNNLKGQSYEIFDPWFFSLNGTPGPLIHGLKRF
jgi:hypothetical protein